MFPLTPFREQSRGRSQKAILFPGSHEGRLGISWLKKTTRGEGCVPSVVWLPTVGGAGQTEGAERGSRWRVL